MRGIVTNISIQDLKKARGTIRAVSRVAVPEVRERFVREAQVLVEQEGRALRQRMLLETVELCRALEEAVR